MRTTLVTLVLAGTVSAAPLADQPKPVAPKAAAGKLWAGLSVSRVVYDPDTWTLETFSMHLALVNDSDRAIETGARESVLIVNGKPMEDAAWRAPLRNEPADTSWDKLSPSDTTSISFPIAKLFPEPGVYRVSWKGKEFESAEVVFRVLHTPLRTAPSMIAGQLNGNSLAAAGVRHPLYGSAWLAPQPKAVAPKPDAPKIEAAKPVPGQLWAVLGVSRLITYEADANPRNQLQLFLDLVNDGDQTVTTDASQGYLVINGIPLGDHAWDMAQFNGLFSGNDWIELPPRQSSGRGIGAGRWFQAPGIYRVSWKGPAFESPEIVLRVLPRKKN